MKLFAPVLLLITIGLLGSGGLEYFHNLQDMAEDRLEDAKALAMHLPADKHPIHDESNCDMHAQLHLAMFFTQWVPLLVCAGLFIAFLTQLPTPLIRRHVPVRVDCRGPPARRVSF